MLIGDLQINMIQLIKKEHNERQSIDPPRLPPANNIKSLPRLSRKDSEASPEEEDQGPSNCLHRSRWRRADIGALPRAGAQ